MGKMSIVSGDETEKQFRDTVARYRGTRKGSLSKAMEEAIELWIRKFDTAIFPH
ncbi:MAG: hypothetical protein ACRD47_13090 [Nitrososphaeraceae archaeon]